MSQFRNQLHAAQLSYHAPSFPDDLGSHLLPPRRKIWPVLLGTLLAGAAAAILVIVLLNEVVAPPQRSDAVKAEPAAVVASMPALPQMPRAQTSLTAVGDQPIFLPALPSFPSLADVLGGSNPLNESPNEPQTSRESL